MPEREEIARVLEHQQEAILAAWMERCPHPPEGSHPDTSTTETLINGFHALTTFLRSGDDEPLGRFVEAVASRTVAAGVAASQAIPVLLAFKPACMTALRAHDWSSPRLLSASEELDSVVGESVSRFGERYVALVEALQAKQVLMLKESEDRLLAQTKELAEQRRESEQRASEIDALNRGATALNSTLEMERLLDIIANRAAELMGTSLSAIFQWDAESGELHGLSAAGIQRKAMLRIAEGVSLVPGDIQRVIEERLPLAIPDMEQAASRLPSGALKVAGEQGIRASLAAPIVVRDQLFGYLATYFPIPRSFTDHEIALLSTFAESAAAALENARLYGQARRVAALEERNRIAREIHDTLAQNLSGLVLQLQGVDRYLDRDPAVAREELTEAVRVARGALREARRSVWEMRARPLEEASLVDAIRSETERVQQVGLDIQLQVEGSPVPLSAEVDHHLYRIAQESLANVRRHSRARTAVVTVRFLPVRVELEVRDDGIGFGQKEQVGEGMEHFGLLGMRDRARLMGGDLSVESSPGEGTRILARVPLSPDAESGHAH